MIKVTVFFSKFSKVMRQKINIMGRYNEQTLNKTLNLKQKMLTKSVGVHSNIHFLMNFSITTSKRYLFSM